MLCSEGNSLSNTPNKSKKIYIAKFGPRFCVCSRFDPNDHIAAGLAMEAVELPTPTLPPVDMERAMDELKCDVGIMQACGTLDARVVDSLRSKVLSVAAESQKVVQDLLSDTKKVRLKLSHSMAAACGDWVSQLHVNYRCFHARPFPHTTSH